jgi:hypothetical protein
MKLVIPAPGYPPGAPIDAGTGGRGTAPTCSTGGLAAASAAAAGAGAALIGANIPTGADGATGATGGCTAANGRIAAIPAAGACAASPTTACGAAPAGEITSLAARSMPRSEDPAESNPACCATASAAAAGAAGEAPETAGDGGGAIAAAAARNAVPYAAPAAAFVGHICAKYSRSNSTICGVNAPHTEGLIASSAASVTRLATHTSTGYIAAIAV